MHSLSEMLLQHTQNNVGVYEQNLPSIIYYHNSFGWM